MDPAAERRTACSATRKCGKGERCVEGYCEQITSCDFPPVRFGFNEASLPAEARESLGEVAECLKGKSGKMRLEGHADERGTEDYNLQLSNRRAASVKKYLQELGVKAGNLEAVGYGENRPAQQGETEDAWAANRRVELREE